MQQIELDPESVRAYYQSLRDWIEHDADIQSLRHLPRFRALMARLGPPSSP